MKIRNIVLPLLAAVILFLPACKKVAPEEETTAGTTEEEITTELTDQTEPAYTHPLQVSPVRQICLTPVPFPL